VLGCVEQGCVCVCEQEFIILEGRQRQIFIILEMIQVDVVEAYRNVI